MNFFAKHKRIFIISLLGSAFISPILSSCGGGGSDTVAGIGGTGITQGEITAFGSVFVNGIKFNTDNSEYEVDGNIDPTLSDADLAIGMVVTIRGDVDSNGTTGRAVSVEYDDDIQGPVASITDLGNGQKELVIFDKTVIIDETSTKFNNTNFTDIVENDIVEISGFDSSASEINATFVKKIGVYPTITEIELKGTISGLSSTSFSLADINIDYDFNTEIDVPNGSLSNSLFVEVVGNLQSSTTILAKEIEFEDEGFEDGSEVSLQGVISEFNGLADFTVAGQAVDASGAILSPTNATLTVGVNVEVDGDIVNGVLVANEVELRQGSVKIQALVSDVDTTNKQFTYGLLGSNFGLIVVNVDNQTSFEDEVAGTLNYSLNLLQSGDFVKMEGLESGGQIVASRVKRVGVGLDEIEVRGSVDSVETTSSLTILGIRYEVDVSTTYFPVPDAATFFATVEPGFIVEAVDTNNDGTAESLEIKD